MNLENLKIPEGMRGTYSPEDNHLRIYCTGEWFEKDLLAEFHAHGFRWCPKTHHKDLGEHGSFRAGYWSPERADFVKAICGEIEDEDTTFAERSMNRARRFEGYQERRTQESEDLANYAEQRAGGIPDGQDIMIAHHSADRAHREAKKIEKLMEKAVEKFETAEYWEMRIKHVLAHAKDKGNIRTRVNRIKKLQKEHRKYEKAVANNEERINEWTEGVLTLKKALRLASFSRADVPDSSKSLYRALEDGDINPYEAQKIALARVNGLLTYSFRWLSHTVLRLNYEKEILKQQGGLHLLEPPPRPKQAPLVNTAKPCPKVDRGFRSAGIVKDENGEPVLMPLIEVTKAQYSKIDSDRRGTMKVPDESGRTIYRYRIASPFELEELGIDVSHLGRWDWPQIFIADQKIVEPPAEVEKVAASA